MIDKGNYKKELVRMWDSIRDNNKGYTACDGASCDYCVIKSYCGAWNCADDSYNAFEIIETVEKWSKEHPQKHKISKLEYDILEYFDQFTNCYFNWGVFLSTLMEKGYFKGADKKMKISDYLQNCEVINNEQD